MVNNNVIRKAFKEVNREVKGYVELLVSIVDKSSYTLSGVGDDVLEITSLSQANDGSRIVTKYATLEKDNFILDGSIILASQDINENAGYISSQVSDNDGYITDFEITINSETLNNVDGITLYFDKEIYPTQLYYYKDDKQIEIENDKDVLNIIDDIFFVDGKIKIGITKLSKANSRIRISEIDLGITNIYQNRDLINMKIVKEIDLLSTSTPIGECDITINDDDNLFNFINPEGIFDKLNNNVKLIPYLGINTETGGIEYLKQGEFYYEDCSINNDKTVSITAKDIMNKFSKEKFICRLEFKENENFFPTSITEDKFKQFLNFSYYNYRFEYDFQKWSGMSMAKISDENIIDFLRPVAVLQNTVLCVTNDNKIKFLTLNDNIVETLTYTELKEKPNFDKSDKVNTVILVKYNTKSTSNNSKETYNHIMQEENDYISIKSNYSYSGSFTQTGASLMGTIAKGLHLTTLLLVGNVGNNVTITVSGNTVYEESSSELVVYRDNQIPVSKVTYKLDNEVVTFYNPAVKQISDFIFNHSFDYKVNLSYNGNPTYECGDKISVETDYGYKNIIITKHELTFDGSLSGKIEGVGN